MTGGGNYHSTDNNQLSKPSDIVSRLEVGRKIGYFRNGSGEEGFSRGDLANSSF